VNAVGLNAVGEKAVDETLWAECRKGRGLNAVGKSGGAKRGG
jgi:hypothetical protein